ncbi:hypothetical protein [Listeria sp. ILCC792]|uniref:hypothetical protein n=1 Tax=Listeria sp. ILCC792 TaxID=1918331 RepID=UPI000B58BCD5|nr:hypothetical protein [Listeria sp. ILCC792]
MEKDALKFLVDQGIKPVERIQVIDGQHYVIDNLGEVQRILPKAIVAQNTLNTNTLSSLIHYIKANLERIDCQFIVHVVSETHVMVKGLLEIDGEREVLLSANAIVPEVAYDCFYDAESFNILLQSKFVANEDRATLLQVSGNIISEDVQQTSDDGTSQAVSIRQGVASQADVKVPNPVTLAPYRTFIEVEQPESLFIFRMKDGPRCALFEADGGFWRNEAIARVRDYLAEALSEEIYSKKITLIA